MPKILPLNPHVLNKISKHNLGNKVMKQISLLQKNPLHPGLNVELLEPKRNGVYSFRVDRKFRALFIYRDDKQAIEIITITVHYH